VSSEKYQSGWKNRNLRYGPARRGGREVRDAAALEREAHRSDVDLLAQDRDAHRPDFDDGLAHEVERDVEIVDEEVEDDIDVEGAGHEDPEPVRLDELHLRHEGPHGHHGGVEALDVPHLEDPAPLLGQRDEPVGFGQSHADGLLDEDVGPAREQLFGHLGMGRSGRRNHHGRGAGVEELADAAAPHHALGAVLRLDGGGRLVALLDEAHGLGPLDFGEDARVVAPEVAAAHDARSENAHQGPGV
jgi:hypothetical protein